MPSRLSPTPTPRFHKRLASFLEDLEWVWIPSSLLLLLLITDALLWMAWSIKSLQQSLEAGRREQVAPPIVTVVDKALSQAFVELLPKTILPQDQINRVVLLASRQLAADLVNDPNGDKSYIFREWIRAWTDLPQAADRQQKSVAVLPYFKNALDVAIQALGLPADVTKMAREKISSLSEEGLSGVVKGFTGEVGKGLFEASRRLVGWGPSWTPVTVTCQRSDGRNASTPCPPVSVITQPHGISPGTQDRAPSFDVQFGPDQYQVRSQEQFKAISEARMQFKTDMNSQLLLRAYTDRTGSEAHNRQLAQQRGDAIRAELMKKGVPASRIGVAAMAEQDLPVPTQKGVSALANRVVQIKVR